MSAPAQTLWLAPDGMIWVCRVCGCCDSDRRKLAFSWCTIHAQLCYADTLQFEDGVVVHAQPVLS